MSSSRTATRCGRPGTSVGVAAVTAAVALLLLVGCRVEVDVPEDLLPNGTPDTASPQDAPVADVGPLDALPDTPGPTDTLPPADVPWPPIDLILPETLDAGPIDDAIDARDGADAADQVAPPEITPLPEFRFCPWEMDALPRWNRSTLLLSEDFEEAPSLSSPSDAACPGGFPSPSRPERVFLLSVPTPTGLSLRTRCRDWDCDAVLLREDCVSFNREVCAATDGDERYADEPLRAGEYILIVEPRGAFEPGPFDLQVALNNREGREPCPVVGEIRVSELADVAPCAPGGGVREVTLSGNTNTSGWRDEIFTDCDGADSIGGAPEMVWRVVGDPEDGAARTLSAEVTVTDGDWVPLLAVTGAPCGAAGAVIDCDRARDGAARVEDVTLFDDEALYVVVDGVGELALDGRAAGPFELRLRVSDPTCP